MGRFSQTGGRQLEWSRRAARLQAASRQTLIKKCTLHVRCRSRSKLPNFMFQAQVDMVSIMPAAGTSESAKRVTNLIFLNSVPKRDLSIKSREPRTSPGLLRGDGGHCTSRSSHGKAPSIARGPADLVAIPLQNFEGAIEAKQASDLVQGIASHTGQQDDLRLEWLRAGPRTDPFSTYPIPNKGCVPHAVDFCMYNHHFRVAYVVSKSIQMRVFGQQWSRILDTS